MAAILLSIDWSCEMKNLVNEVLGKHAYKKGNEIWEPIDEYEGIKMSPNAFVEVNIHEFAHRCKKWAFDLGYTIDTKMTYSELKSREYGSKPLDACHNVNFDNGTPYNPVCDIKVCEWILKNDERFSE